MQARITPQDIITFWYSEEVKPLWFNSTEEFDRLLTEEYLSVYESAFAGELSHWEGSPEGLLALVIILDQFPLNMFRGDKRAFEAEAEAQRLCHVAVDKGLDKQISNSQLAFLYMPLMHSEDIKDQDLAVELFDAAGLEDNAKFAHHHRTIVEKFGRFPHRNKILGRQSSEAELAYLNSDEAFLG